MAQGRLRGSRITVALLGVFPFIALAAEVYSWTDEQGVVHFSDRAPQTADARRVEPATPVLVPMGDNLKAADRIAETLSARDPGRRSGRSPSGKRNSDRQRRCERYREQLENIQSRLRAGYSNAQGNRLRKRRRDLNGRLSRECILGQAGH